jgi:hypothetical protein
MALFYAGSESQRSSGSGSPTSTSTSTPAASPRGKGGNGRVVPFPAAFKETHVLHLNAQRLADAVSLFRSNCEKPYSGRGVSKVLAR